jgi:MbtH protein
MISPSEDQTADFRVLVNEERQCSLWPAFQEVLAGWKSVMQGKRQECLEWIENSWTDMRPRSLVDAMDKIAK